MRSLSKRLCRTLIAAAIVFSSSARGASADGTPETLAVPQVVRVPTTFAWNGRGGTGTSPGGAHPVPQGLEYVPFQTIEQRSAALDAIARARYADAMAKNKVRGEGVRLQLRGPRF